MIAALLLASWAVAAERSTAMSELVVSADGFQDSTGQAVLQIRGPDDPFRPGRFTRQVFAPIHAGTATFRIGAFPSGRWALLVFHDRDGNGTLNHNVLRFPFEPMGFSGGYRIGLLSGMPTFPKLAVDVAPGPAQVVIHVR